jgi:anti-sigma28 factor (negative regulator of flagellin synthesis)
MSIRVSTTDVALTSQTDQADQLKPAGSGGSTGHVFGKTTEDHIDVSAATENINSALATQNLQHAQKIQQLSNLVANGRYTIDSGDLSRAIVSSAISGTDGE